MNTKMSSYISVQNVVSLFASIVEVQKHIFVIIIECVRNYDEGLDQVSASLGLDIEEEIGLSKILYNCLSDKMLNVTDSENKLLEIEEKVKKEIDQSFLKAELLQKTQNVLGIMDSLKTSQINLRDGQKKLGNLHKINRKEVCSVIQTLKLVTMNSKSRRMESTHVPSLQPSYKSFQLGHISFQSIISIPQVYCWTDLTSFYRYEPKLVNASENTCIVNMDDTVTEVKYSRRSLSEVKRILIKSDAEMVWNEHPKRSPPSETLQYKRDISIPKLPKAVNSVFMYDRNICLTGNEGTLYLLAHEIGRITQLNLDQIYGGIVSKQLSNKVMLVHRKDGTIVEVNNPFKMYTIFAGRNNPKKQHVVEATVVTTDLADPVKIAVYKEDSIYVVVGCSSHKIYILNDKRFVNSGEKKKTKEPSCDKIELVRSFGEFGEGEGQLNHPNDVAVTHYGTLLVADTNNYRITEYSITGEFLRTLISFKREREKVYSLSYNINQQQLWVVVQGQRRRLLCCEFMSD